MSALPSARSSVLFGLLLGLAPLSVLGTLLFRATHHRPLGAVTFALLGAGLLAGTVLIAKRSAREGGTGWSVCRAASVVSGLSVTLQLLLALVTR